MEMEGEAEQVISNHKTGVQTMRPRFRVLVEHVGVYLASVFDEYGLLTQATGEDAERAVKKAKKRARNLRGEKIEFVVNDITGGTHVE
jgi:hypothetical protein